MEPRPLNAPLPHLMTAKLYLKNLWKIMPGSVFVILGLMIATGVLQRSSFSGALFANPSDIGWYYVLLALCAVLFSLLESLVHDGFPRVESLSKMASMAVGLSLVALRMVYPSTEKDLVYSQAAVEAAVRADQYLDARSIAPTHAHLKALFKSDCDERCVDSFKGADGDFALTMTHAKTIAKDINGKSILSSSFVALTLFMLAYPAILMLTSWLGSLTGTKKAFSVAALRFAGMQVGSKIGRGCVLCVVFVFSRARNGAKSILLAAARVAGAAIGAVLSLPKTLARAPGGAWRACQAAGRAAKSHVQSVALSDPEAIARYEKAAMAEHAAKSAKSTKTPRL